MCVLPTYIFQNLQIYFLSVSNRFVDFMCRSKGFHKPIQGPIRRAKTSI